MKKNTLILILICLISLSFYAQNTRLNENNTIGWYNYFGTFKIHEKFSLNTEYQFRRDNLIIDKQQGLLRLGLNYKANNKLQLRIGYANIETYPYGDIPINGFGKNFTEHRTFQVATLTEKINSVDISHRFMIEQRWVGRYSNLNLTREDEFPMLNRIRYMFRIQMPIRGKLIQNKTPYIALYDEIFIGFGNNVNENIFDQNRVGILLGYQFNENIRIEGGYLNQTLQLVREINNRNVFQNNNGLIINTHFNFDLTKKKKTNL